MGDVTASGLMRDFAIRTGVVPGGRPPKRYLWTDAFAVCNFLGLHVEAREAGALELARRLVDQTHEILGKHRPDAPVHGWLSGLGEELGARHPTRGGLRIGKPLPERDAREPFDAELEWERDGQYFHYLTKWMHALGAMARVSGDATYHRWAVELAKTAHRGFSVPRSPHGPRGLYWKMSVDLSRPLVPSMGHHDPLDGLLTFEALQRQSEAGRDDDLGPEIDDLARLCRGRRWDTEDPLGIGGLLCDAWRSTRWIDDGEGAAHRSLCGELLDASIRGLRAFLRSRPLDRPVETRLAFREFGLSIGLRAVARLRGVLEHVESSGLRGCERSIGILAECEPLAAEIEQFWSPPSRRRSASWLDHRDINDVMFATSLAPGGFLGD